MWRPVIWTLTHLVLSELTYKEPGLVLGLTRTSKPLKQPICLRLPNESGYGHEICPSRLCVTFYGKKHTTLFKDHQLVTQEWLVMDLKGNQLTCYLYDLSSKMVHRLGWRHLNVNALTRTHVKCANNFNDDFQNKMNDIWSILDSNALVENGEEAHGWMTLPKHWTIVLEVCWDVEDGDDNFAWKTIWGNTMHFMMLEMMSLRLLKLQVNEILSDLDPNSMDYFIPLGCHVSGSIPLIAHFSSHYVVHYCAKLMFLYGS